MWKAVNKKKAAITTKGEIMAKLTKKQQKIV